MPNKSSRKATPGSFKPGDPRAGRPPGRVNRTTQEIRDLAQRLLTDRHYVAKLKERLNAGTAGRIEELLYFYAWGKPKDETTPLRAHEDEGEDDVITIDVRKNGHGTL
jgi:hypothetical protein